MKPYLARVLLWAGKILLAGVLLAWVLSQVHWYDYALARDDGTHTTRPGVLSCIGGLKWHFMVCAVLSQIVSALVTGLRWRMLLAVQQVRIGIKDVFKLVMLGDFCSNVLPGTLGGDAVKAYLVAEKTPRKLAVLVSVFVDRAMGMCVVTLLATIMFTAVWGSGHTTADTITAPAVSILAVLVVLAGGGAFVTSSGLRRLLHLQEIYRRLPLSRFLSSARDVLAVYRRNGRSLLKAMWLSLVSQSLSIVSVVLIGLSLDLSTAWYEYFICVPLVQIISAVPLTPGSVGVMEELYLLYLAPGDDPSKVLVLALLVRASVVVASLPGAVVAATMPRLPRSERVRSVVEISEGSEE